MPHWAGSGKITHTHTQRVRGQRRLEGGVAVLKLQSAMEKLFSKESHQKAQSAMEYLMTYGWAILIIAVVLGALFQLGIFNANNFAPKAPPGACQVFRPNGPGTTSFINLEGVCSGELPQYVAQFNGANAYIWLGTPNILEVTKFTIAAWFDTSSSSFQRIYRWLYYGIMLTVSGQCSVAFYNSSATLFIAQSPQNCNDGKWHFAVGTYNGSSLKLYVDGVLVTSISTTAVVYYTSSGAAIGREGAASLNYFNGSIANVQIYNTSLSASEIQALYQEGIGGAPIDLQNLVGWWPLNGNANDYSGNGNNGQATNVIYTGSWTSGYTPP
jgi:hypothetical protein